MTGVYESKPIPHCLDIICPGCRHRAQFEFAETITIKLKADIAFFQNSSVFAYQRFRNHEGRTWHGAVYFQGLHGDPRKTLHDLPPGYTAQDWEHPKYGCHRAHWPIGSYTCSHCHARAVHRLNWPQDAYFSVSYRNHVLWAFHRESAIALTDYLASTQRSVWGYGWVTFLQHVPTVFKVRKAREAVVKQMGKLLDTKHIGRRST
jgi:hypothetical protein